VGDGFVGVELPRHAPEVGGELRPSGLGSTIHLYRENFGGDKIGDVQSRQVFITDVGEFPNVGLELVRLLLV
jgi:hypothetical protein